MADILVNDIVRLRVKFVDIGQDGSQVNADVSAVLLKIYNSDNLQILSVTPISVNASEYYYDYSPSLAGVYKVTFSGIKTSGATIVVNQQVYVSTSSLEYKPTINLKENEVITFAADIEPVYLDPELLLPFFPDVSLLEIGELIYSASLEVKSIYKLLDTENGDNIPFTALEYIRASTCCELTRAYGNGGDDELSIRLGDLSVTNRSLPRNTLSRANATTWCQIAAVLRKEMLTAKTGIRAVQPKGLPTMPTIGAGNNMDPYTGLFAYQSSGANPIPSRKIRKYD